MDEEKYNEAKIKAKAIRIFYIHLIIYICINLFLTIFDFIKTPGLWFYWPIIIWGIIVFGHALGVFAFGGVFRKDWEERKVKTIMDKNAIKEEPKEEPEGTTEEEKNSQT